VLSYTGCVEGISGLGSPGLNGRTSYQGLLGGVGGSISRYLTGSPRSTGPLSHHGSRPHRSGGIGGNGIPPYGGQGRYGVPVQTGGIT
jgi:hypothetical protein